MPDVIKEDGSIIQDDWVVFERPAEGESLNLPNNQPALIPVDLWLAGRDHYIGRRNIGVWFESDQEPETLGDLANELDVIAVNFPKFSDGRGYSIARLLRDRLGYRNELRAIGDVLLDQLQYMKRCGFNRFVLRADKNAEEAARCLNFFSQGYQAATDTDIPLFRRRAS